MRWQAFVGRIDEPQQLRAVAFETEPTTHELQFTTIQHCGMLAERIGFNIWNELSILGGHRRFYPHADDSVKSIEANGV